MNDLACIYYDDDDDDDDDDESATSGNSISLVDKLDLAASRYFFHTNATKERKEVPTSLIFCPTIQL